MNFQEFINRATASDYSDLGQRAFSRLYDSLSPFRTLQVFLIILAICEISWQLIFKKGFRETSHAHLVLKFLSRLCFYSYLMLVYKQTGVIGVFHRLGHPLIPRERIFLIPFSSSPDIVPFLFNILMTLPLGLMLPLFWPSCRNVVKVAVIGLLFSFSIEFVQLFTYRVTTVDDLMMNTTGAILGYGIYFFSAGWALKIRQIYKRRRYNSQTGTVWLEPLFYIIVSLLGVVFFVRS